MEDNNFKFFNTTASEAERITTGYTPRPGQKIIHDCDARFVLLVAHRRYGKSVMECNHHIDRGLKNLLRNPQYAYIGPSYKSVKRIVWQYFVDYTRNLPGIDPSTTELTVRLHRDWHIDPLTLKVDPDIIKWMLIGADDPDSIRGMYLDGASLDEFAQIDPILLGQVVRPALSDRAKIARQLAEKCTDLKMKETLLQHMPWMHICGTPKGQNHFYRRFVRSKEQERLASLYDISHDISFEEKRFTAIDLQLGIDDDTPMKDIEKKLDGLTDDVKGEYLDYRKYLANKQWKVFVCRASETGILSRDEIESMIEEMDPDEVEQELECSFNAAIKGSYFGHLLNSAKEDGRVGKFPYNPAFPVNTFWDLGINDHNAIWFVQKMPGGNYHYIDYHEDRNLGFVEYLKIISRKNYNYGVHIWPHDGKQREYVSGKTRQEAAEEMGREFGFRVQIQKRQLEEDQIEAARNRIPISFFDEDLCARGLECLANFQKQWDEKLQCYKKNALHDWSSNGAKAFMYSALDDNNYSFAKNRKDELELNSYGLTDYDEFG